MKSTLINDELVQVPKDLANAIAGVRQDAKKKGAVPPQFLKMQKGKKGEEEMEDDEDMEEEEDDEYMEDSSESDAELDEAIEAMIEKNDALEAENAVLQAIARRQDAEEVDPDEADEDEFEEEEMTEEEFEQIVQDSLEQIVRTDAVENYIAARLELILDAADAAKGFLPADFSIRDHADAHEIMAAALRHSLPHLDSEDSGMNWNSPEAIEGGFKTLVSQSKRTDAAIDVIERQYVPLAERGDSVRRDSDLAPSGNRQQKRHRAPNYSAK